MKPYVPHNLVLLMAIAVAGFMALYNFTLRDHFATVLRYEFPVVEQVETQKPKNSSVPEDPHRIVPEDQDWDEGDFEEEAEESETPESVRFPLDINTATVAELMFIPQVGEVMAQRIWQYRAHLGGRYDDLEQLRDIKGVGDKTFERLCTYLYIPEQEPQYIPDQQGPEE